MTKLSLRSCKPICGDEMSPREGIHFPSVHCLQARSRAGFLLTMGLLPANSLNAARVQKPGGSTSREGFGWWTTAKGHAAGAGGLVVRTQACLIPQHSSQLLYWGLACGQAQKWLIPMSYRPDSLPPLSKPGLVGRCPEGPVTAHHSGHLGMCLVGGRGQGRGRKIAPQ